jgi:hypothetical protein
MKRNSVFGKMVVLGIIGAFAALALATPALAQKAKEMDAAAKMMSDGWKQFNDGQSTIIKGVEMNNLVAVQGGFQDLMAPGNQVITTGRETAARGAKLFAQGEKTYLDNKGAPSVAKQGINMMVDGFKIAQDGKEMIKKGTAMNDQVAQGKGALDKFAQGNQVIKTGMETMEGGAKLFMQGEALYLKNK